MAQSTRTSLPEIYGCRECGDVEQFLGDHPEVPPILKPLAARLRDIFGSDARITAEILRHPDELDYPVLRILVHTALDPNEAFDRLECFAQDWWLDLPPTVQANVIVDFSLL